MAILKETNMWFILIVVFVYVDPLGFLRTWNPSVRDNAGSAQVVAWQNQRRVPRSPKEPRGSLGVDFAFCISF